MTAFHLVRRSFTTRSTRLLIVLALIGAPALLAAGGAAPGSTETLQDPSLTPEFFNPDDVPAHIAIVEGNVTVDREGRTEDAVEGDALLAGDRVRTDRGRAEILFADGSALDLDQFSTVDFQSDSLIRLLAGRVRLALSRSATDVDYRVDSAPASVVIRSAGEYRIELSEGRAGMSELDIAVLRGTAELQNALGRTLVRAGTRARATARTEPSLPYAFNSASWDAFDRWAEDQRDARFGVASSRYLPADLRYYSGVLDRSGAWNYEPSYGYVWYPRVEPLWRPYYAGRWSFVSRVGWLWIGADRWAWPTHHYGRWGINANRWFWIPDRRWSPAWVSWASAPGYVSWCPLGFDSRPVISVTNITYRSGWTVVPARAFAPRVVVTHHAVDVRDLSPYVRNALSIRSDAPITVSGVRNSAPLRAPGADRRAPGRTAPAVSSRDVAVPRGIVGAQNAPLSTTPSRSAPRTWNDTMRPNTIDGRAVASTTASPRDAGRVDPGRVDPGRVDPGRANPGVVRSGSEPARRPPPQWRVDPGATRVDGPRSSDDSPRPSRPDAEPNRAEPRRSGGPGRPDRVDGRGGNGGEAARPGGREPSAQPSPGGRSRPPNAPSEGRAVPRSGRGDGIQNLEF